MRASDINNLINQRYDADREVNQFLHIYEAQAGLSGHKQYYRRRPIRYTDWVNDGSPIPFDQYVDTEPMVEMYMPQDKFRRLVEREQEFRDLVRGNEESNYRLRQSIEEEKIRNGNPAVKSAYEKYKMLLELARK
jgi:hypothetical protein